MAIHDPNFAIHTPCQLTYLFITAYSYHETSIHYTGVHFDATHRKLVSGTAAEEAEKQGE